MSQSATESQGQESGNQGGTGTGQESGTGTEGQGQESGQQDGQFDLNTIQDPAVRAYLEKVQKDAQAARSEAAKYRTERNQHQSEAERLRQANESEADRIARESTERQERLEALERENRELRVGTAITNAAAEAKAFNPALVATMLDAKVVLDDKGQPTNLKDLLRDLRTSDPYLFKRTDNDAGAGTGQHQAPTGSMNDLIRGQVAARRGRPTS